MCLSVVCIDFAVTHNAVCLGLAEVSSTMTLSDKIRFVFCVREEECVYIRLC